MSVIDQVRHAPLLPPCSPPVLPDPFLVLPCFVAYINHQVLEQRLVQHEENALKKYADVDAKLASDPRLRALTSGA